MASIALSYPVSKPRPGFHQAMGLLAVWLLAFDLALAKAVGLEGFGHQIAGSLMGAGALMALYGYCRWSGLQKFQELSLLGLWAVLLSNGISVLIQAAGRSPIALMDSTLAGIDQSAGFSTTAIVRWVQQYQYLRVTLDVSYKLLPLLILMSLFVPVLTGHAAHARRFLAAVMIAAGITAILFAFVPAAGPWVAGGYQPNATQANVTAYLGRLKAGGGLQINADASAVVSFPSFHVVLALLPVFALWPIRRIRIIMIAVSTLICVSTITTGWHYGIDVLGGFAVTFLAQWLAGGLRREPRPEAEPWGMAYRAAGWRER